MDLLKKIDRCSGCGCCCNPIVLGKTKTEFIRSYAENSDATTRKDADFMHKHWKRISRKKAAEISEYASSSKGSFYYLCDMFNEVTRSCSCRDDRPPACYWYPIYAMTADVPLNSQYENCGYNGLVLSQKEIDDVEAIMRQIASAKEIS